LTATETPVENEGTYPLSQAQIDRFMLKVPLTYPSRSEEQAILERMGTTEPDLSVRPVVSTARIKASRHVVSRIYIGPQAKDYILNLVLATRKPQASGMDLNGYIHVGASPRTTINLTLAARASAFLGGRAFVTPQDVKNVAMDVLRHRIIVSYEAETENITSEHIIEKILQELPMP
jgi:MoxR-like ATPase